MCRSLCNKNLKTRSRCVFLPITPAADTHQIKINGTRQHFYTRSILLASQLASSHLVQRGIKLSMNNSNNSRPWDSPAQGPTKAPLSPRFRAILRRNAIPARFFTGTMRRGRSCWHNNLISATKRKLPTMQRFRSSQVLRELILVEIVFS